MTDKKNSVKTFFHKAGSIMSNGLMKVGQFFHFLNGKKAYGSLVSSILCIVVGLLAGLVVLLCLDPAAGFQGLAKLLTAGFSDGTTFGRVLYKATPMMLSGLAIAFSFKLGLFNIGITGQVTIGAFSSVIVGILGANWFVCLLVGMIAGALAGFIPGFLKAKFNVNEVLSGIMLNWIIYYVIGLIGSFLPSSFKHTQTPTELINLPQAARLPSLNIDSLPGVDIGLIIAIAILIIFEIILVKTKFGFELKLSGSNKFAAQYAGMNQTKNIILALTISGALAGICGYIIYANPLSSLRFYWSSGNQALLSDGFTGISVSLIAQNSPIGCILSSILLTMIDAAQTPLKNVSSTYNVHYTELIKAIIIYFASFSSFFGMLLRHIYEKKENKIHHHDINEETPDDPSSLNDSSSGKVPSITDSSTLSSNTKTEAVDQCNQN